MASPHREEWIAKDAVEFVKLVRDTQTLQPVMHPTKSPTYYNRVVKEKWDRVTKSIVRRVRGTAGGDRITQTDVSSAAASLTSLKCLLNKTVSEHALFATIDLTDFT